MKNLDMIKFILFASLLLSLAGIGLYFYQKSDLSELTRTIPICTKKLTKIGELSAQVELAKKEIMRDELQNLKAQVYVEQQANASGISYRSYLEFKPMGLKKKEREGYVDQPYEINPLRKKKFDRRKIATFLFKLEAHTNRLKVTKFTLDQPNPANYEEWNMSMELTERRPL
jgi:hypothetical protein